jgi:hypothetical protein
MVSRSTLSIVAKGIVKETLVSAVYASIVLGGFEAVRYFRSSPHLVEADASVPRISVGADLKLEGESFADHPVSFLLITSPSCHYCLKSESFHRRLVVEAQGHSVPLFVLVPKLHDADTYLQKLGVSTAMRKEWSHLNLQVSGTPTLIGIDANGLVKSVWLGVVAPSIETTILSDIRNRSLRTSLVPGTDSVFNTTPNYSASEVKALILKHAVQLIDPRERGLSKARKDVVTMPLLELPTRAEIELDKTHLQVVDCSNINEQNCGHAVSQLASMGFRVATLGAGSYRDSCQVTPVTRSGFGLPDF